MLIISDYIVNDFENNEKLLKKKKNVWGTFCKDILNVKWI